MQVRMWHGLGAAACSNAAVDYFAKAYEAEKNGDYDKAIAYRSAAKLLGEFALGTGQYQTDFTQSDPFAQMLNKNNQLLKEVKQDFEAELKTTGMSAEEYFGGNPIFSGGYEFSPNHAGTIESLKKHLAALSNKVDFVIGGMTYTVTPMYDENNKLASYNIVFTNIMGKESLMLHEATDVGNRPEIPLADKKQTFTFNLTIDEYNELKTN